MPRKLIGAVLALVVLACVLATAQEAPAQNLSADRGFGLGASLSVYPFSYIPWPFVNFVLSDAFAVSFTGVLTPGVFGVSAALEYRLLNGAAFDILPALSVGAAFGSGFFGASVSAGVIAEYSLSRAIALRLMLSLALSLSVGIGFSFLYYF